MDQTEVTTGEAARILGVSPTTVIAYVEQGHLQVRYLPSGHRRFLRADVERLRSAEPQDAA
jgi:excisionase family DNA binding protein